MFACPAEYKGCSQQHASDSILVDRREIVRIIDRLEKRPGSWSKVSNGVLEAIAGVA
ncbi:MAG: hypothetical protein M3Y62_00905 [Candidatus Dormibacteraeota bacterium]|nr:hypothetical protein [Candidatus Dormibacteraeota bacterium]